ncbi:hypothetical protein PybrP1_004630 [[Pythium] brassicae (nom. inval.)]|nr:hypothetical protein PybrP1_004630 [[Pythium] brassicae (nom. inval.)]
MERAHVLIRLRGDPQSALLPAADGVTRTSATAVRLEHSAMSPGVASISFERVFDAQHTPLAHMFDQSLAPAVARCAQGFSASLVLAGAPGAGKSFACHGDRQQRTTGLVTLALRHVFRELDALRDADAALESQVLLGCFHVGESGQLVDLMRSPAAAVVASPLVGSEHMLLQRSVRVATSAEAFHWYSQALAASVRATDGRSDFAVAVFIETKRAGEQRVRRGRLICIDVHGSSIVDPSRWQDATKKSPSAMDARAAERPVFSDAHFPVATGLSNWFGGWVGNDAATYVLVVIQKQAQFQQQAIQSLLYACKAKDIKSTCSVAYVPAFTSKPITAPPAELPRADTDQQGNNQRESQDDNDNHSTTSSNSLGDFATESNETEYERLGSRSPRQPAKHSVLSQRLRQAYQSVKSASGAVDPLNSILTPTKRRPGAEIAGSDDTPARCDGLFATKANLLHAKADAMLKPRANELEALSLLDKLELIRVQYREVERALAHETSVKDKCVDRISKLSQTMSFQVVEHEQQLQRALAEKDRVQAQLSAMALKFEGMSKEVELLQQQVRLVKAARSDAPAPPVAGDTNPAGSSGSTAGSERAQLQQFSSRLETAMHEAKAVVGLKDGVIRDLERRLSESTQANARLIDDLARQRQQHDREAAARLAQLSDLRVQLRGSAEAAAREATRSENERAAFRTRLSQLVLEIETLRASPAGRTSEHRAHAATQTDVVDAAASTGADVDELARQQQRELVERLETKTRECVASHAASVASRRRAEALEQRVEEVARKARKMEKKLRAKRSAAEKRVLALAARLEESERQAPRAARELAELRDAVQQHESARAERTAETAQLQDAIRALETRCAARDQRLHAAETRYQQQVGDLEQSLARRMLAREAQLAAEHDRKLRQVMDRHAAELLAREVDDSERAAPHSPSSRSTLGSSASDSESGSPQRSLEQLDALIGYKEKQFARARDATQRKKAAPSSARSEPSLVAELERKLRELTQALAVANEQETLAKQHAQRSADAQHASAVQREQLLEEMNRLKQENWSLSLALQVTERQRL